MPALLDPTDLVLVVVVTQPRDMEIARLLGWYRIPFKSAPKVVAVDYLAFYQTAGFNDQERWRITAIAPVRGHELTTRAELIRDEPDHPRAGEEYYKIQLGPLQPLPHPIHADQWRRITFLYTTGELLLQAEIVKDLVVRDDERALLWQSLRERALRSGEVYANELPEDQFQLDPLVLATLGGFDQIHDEPAIFEDN
jgi:hypothetical protein